MTQNRVVLDVREQLQKKLDPFEIIMETVKTLKKEDILELHATFKPTPLLGVMRIKGFVSQAQKVENDHWIVTFVHKSQKHLLEELHMQEDEGQDTAPAADEAPANKGRKVHTLDNRGLEPPQPMVRTLAQLDKMDSGDLLVITNDRVPAFLIEELKNLGASYEIEELPDGKARVTITKP